MAMSNDTQEMLQSSYEALLLSYAAGMLDAAQNLIVASHVALNPNARKFVHGCEAVGGALIEKHCEPVAMKDCSLGKVLDRIENACETAAKKACCEAKQAAFPDPLDIPAPLQQILIAQHRAMQWRRIMAGLQAIELDLHCKRSHSRFLKMEPGCKTPHHRHGGLEITLVLDGAFEDEIGQFRRGDLVVTDERINHTPQACNKHGCVAFVVTAAPIRLTGIAALLNPFIKF